MANVTAAELRDYSTRLLAAGGYSSADAGAMADLLVWANMRGVDSHGVLRIPRYVEMLDEGEAQAGHRMEVAQAFGAIRVIDADRAPGAVAMNRAVDEAIDLSRDHGLGWCAVRRTSHAGAIGYFVERVARSGRIGIAMTASKPLMNYPGARGEVLSTNPLAFGMPLGAGREPLLFDMSTAAVALGKVMAAKDAGRAIPTGWAVDSAGVETTDASKVAALLPMAGPKGSGLSLMIEMLCSVLTLNPAIAPVLNGGKNGGFNGMVLALDPAAFGDADAVLAEAAELAEAIRQRDPAPGVDRIRLPGERGYETARKRGESGIDLADGTVRRLAAMAQRLEVAIPSALALPG